MDFYDYNYLGTRDIEVKPTEEGIKLIYRNKEVDLTEVLRNYFVREVYELDPEELAQSISTSLGYDNQIWQLINKICKDRIIV